MSEKNNDMTKVKYIGKSDPLALLNEKIYDARVLKPTEKALVYLKFYKLTPRCKRTVVFLYPFLRR